MQILEQYFEALRSHDWERLAECLADEVHRTGPYCDVVHGRQAYTDYLASVVPKLENYALDVEQIRMLEGGGALVELSETVDRNGTTTKFPEALIFAFDTEGRIVKIDVYLMQPPRSE